MRKLFLDIETFPNRGLFFGLFNQNISINQVEEPGYTLCWAAKWSDSREIMFSSVHTDGMEVMLEKIHALLTEADVVVHYNGKHFDIPILNKEFLNHEMLPPIPYQQIDLLLTVRANFKLTSNKLDFVSQYLGIGKKLPHKGMDLWIGCGKGEDASWKVMERYNKQDVRLLPLLYERLVPWIKNHPNEALYQDIFDKEGNHVECCPNCASTHIVKNGIEPLATQSYQRYKCSDCGTNLRGRSTILTIAKRKSVLTQSKL